MRKNLFAVLISIVSILFMSCVNNPNSYDFEDEVSTFLKWKAARAYVASLQTPPEPEDTHGQIDYTEYEFKDEDIEIICSAPIVWEGKKDGTLYANISKIKSNPLIFKYKGNVNYSSIRLQILGQEDLAVMEDKFFDSSKSCFVFDVNKYRERCYFVQITGIYKTHTYNYALNFRLMY